VELTTVPRRGPLTLCSIFWLSFLVERLLFLRKPKVIPQELSVAFRSLVQEEPFDRGKALALLEEHPSSLAVVLRVALNHLNKGRDEIERSVNSTAQREIYLLRKNIRVFAVIASVAPLMGLLGTVLGLVQAFREVAISGLGSSGAALAPGIYQALITTVAGLVVAIPCLLTYYWLVARIDHCVHEMDNLVEDFVDAHGGAPPAAA
jgi:biopolymer transport protein ExbB